MSIAADELGSRKRLILLLQFVELAQDLEQVPAFPNGQPPHSVAPFVAPAQGKHFDSIPRIDSLKYVRAKHSVQLACLISNEVFPASHKSQICLPVVA